MRLTLHTDLALRILIYLAMHPNEQVSVRVISSAFNVSNDHAAKAAKVLVRLGLIGAKRGRDGGLMMLQDPANLKLGQLIKKLEPLSLLDCDPCLINSACGLSGALDNAVHAFIASLDGTSLADLISNKDQLVKLLRSADDKTVLA